MRREEGGEALGEEEEEEEEEEEVIYPTLGLAPPDVDPWYLYGSGYVLHYCGRQWIIKLEVPSRALEAVPQECSSLYLGWAFYSQKPR